MLHSHKRGAPQPAARIRNHLQKSRGGALSSPPALVTIDQRWTYSLCWQWIDPRVLTVCQLYVNGLAVPSCGYLHGFTAGGSGTGRMGWTETTIRPKRRGRRAHDANIIQWLCMQRMDRMLREQRAPQHVCTPVNCANVRNTRFLSRTERLFLCLR